MAFPRPIAAVVFDMDGLLLDTEGLYRIALMRAGPAFAVEIDDAFVRGLTGLPGTAIRSALAANFGADFPVPAFLDVVRADADALIAEEMTLKAGVVEVLDHLDGLGLPRAVATSSGRRSAVAHLGQAGVLERFDLLITGDDVVRGKPDPEPFLKAAAALGVDPVRCLALEDSHNGVRAAHAAGMMTVMVPDLLDPTEEMHAKCVHIAESLHEVLRLLRA